MKSKSSCSALIAAILDPNSASSSVISPGIALRLGELLDRAHELREVTAFLAATQPSYGPPWELVAETSILWDFDLPKDSVSADLFPGVAVGQLWTTANRWSWEFLAFGEPGARTLNDEGKASPSIASTIQKLQGWREWIRINRASAAASFIDITLDFPCTIVAGRRSDTGEDRNQQLSELNDSLVGIRIRTYDWLIDAATQVGERRTW